MLYFVWFYVISFLGVHISSTFFDFPHDIIWVFTGSRVLWGRWASDRWRTRRFEGLAYIYSRQNEMVPAYIESVTNTTLSSEQFRIKTAPHERFRREGNDLHTTVTITLVIILLNLRQSPLVLCFCYSFTCFFIKTLCVIQHSPTQILFSFSSVFYPHLILLTWKFSPWFDVRS